MWKVQAGAVLEEGRRRTRSLFAHAPPSQQRERPLSLQDLLNNTDKPVFIVVAPDEGATPEQIVRQIRREIRRGQPLDMNPPKPADEALLHAIFGRGPEDDEPIAAEAACNECDCGCEPPEAVEPDWIEEAAQRIQARYECSSVPTPTIGDICRIIREGAPDSPFRPSFDVQGPVFMLNLEAAPGVEINFYGPVGTAIVTQEDGGVVNVWAGVEKELAIEQGGGGQIDIDEVGEGTEATILQGPGSRLDIEGDEGE